jgi:hypothetical protein
MLEDDIILGIFNYCRLYDENDWDNRLGWCKFSHVCRRWRHLIFSSALYLGLRIVCTYGTPTVDTLDHLPPLPLFIEYPAGMVRVNEGTQKSLTISPEDSLGINYALPWLRDRVRRINLHLQLSILPESLVLLYKTFPILEHLYLSLSFTGLGDKMLVLPRTFMAPNLRHLVLLGIRVPKRLQLLSTTLSLVTLKLSKIQASGYFRPRLLAARLESLLQLEELSIEFSVPIPRPSAEGPLLGKQGSPVMLSNLKIFTFRGVSAYLERLVCQIRTPILERMDITFFNQIAFRLPHLSHFLSPTEQFPGIAEVSFSHHAVFLHRHIMGRSLFGSNVSFTLCVVCKPMDWQIDCAAQICSTLLPALSGVEKLSLTHTSSNGGIFAPAILDFNPYEIDCTTWHELLRLFTGVKELRIDYLLSKELSRALEMDEIGFDPWLFPELQKLESQYRKVDSDSFGSFIRARRVAGRPVSLHLLRSEPGDFSLPAATAPSFTPGPSLFGPPPPGTSFFASSSLLGSPPPSRGGLFNLLSPASGGLFSPLPPGTPFGSYSPAGGGPLGPPPRLSGGLFGPRSPRSD